MSNHALRAALVIAVVSTVACGGGTPPPAAGGPPGGMAMPVELQAATPTPVEQATEFVGTVKSRLFRGRRILQKELVGYAVEMGYIKPRDAQAAARALDEDVVTDDAAVLTPA